ncbi:MAG TPA: DHA2 family efflux MFS transporter permease subunit [Candidatus Limnocylindrales bacterium]|nr:DHA2 family efflux MFS transporter permease subunit [Candidatus Limnocylindrales bacterium]
MAARPSSSPSPINRDQWTSLGAVLIGTFMVALDQTIVAIALPQIGVELRASGGIEWIITAYLLALGMIQPATGWLADRIGRKGIFLGGLAVFTAGSLLCALAPSLPLLVMARIVQGLGGGTIFPVGRTMIFEHFPADRRGMAMGMWSLGIAGAPAVGPVLGGFIVTHWDWRLLFLVNGPIGIVGLLVGWRFLRFAGFREPRPFDRSGFALIAIGLGAGLLALSEANDWGWLAPPTLGLFGLAAVALVVFARHALRRDEPLIDVRMFAIPGFSITLAIVGGLVIAQLAVLVFVPLELEAIRGLSPLEVGIILTPAALASAIAGPLGGQLADRIGARPPVLAGLVCIAAATLLLSQTRVDTPVLAVLGMVTLQGFGNSMALPPNTLAGLNVLPQALLARGSALRSTVRQVSGSFGLAALTAVVVAEAGALTPTADPDSAVRLQDAYGTGFLISAGIIGLCLIAAFFLPGAAEMRADRAERAVEHERLMADRSRPDPRLRS